MIKKFAQFEDVLVDTKPTEIIKFGEYRKGSSKYGQLIESIMMWIRMHKDVGDKVKGVSTNLNKFLSETKINLKDLQSFLKEKSKTNLISFDIKIESNIIYFSELDKKSSGLLWEDHEKL